MTTDVLGAPIKRVEDPRFITGKGRYLDDIQMPGMTYMAILRSPYAHANIRSIDTSAAEGDARRRAGPDRRRRPVQPAPDGLAGRRRRRASRTTSTCPRALATDDVKWTGEGVAAVIAETPEQAADAVEAIHVEWEPLPAVVDAEKATQPGAPQLHENAPNNVVFEWTVGDKAGTDAAIDGAEVVVRQRIVNQRLIPNPMEVRGDIGLYNPGHRRVHGLDVEPDAAHPAAPPDRLRDRHPGAQGPLHLARRRRRVRHEDLLLRRHGPGHARLEAHRRPAGQVGRDPPRELPERRPTAATTSPTSRSPASATARSPGSGSRRTPTSAAACRRSARASRPPSTRRVLSGCYKIPNVYCEVTGVYTNTTFVDAYRGAGRPEATYVIERAMDLFADEIGMDPAAIRRKNFIAAGRTSRTTTRRGSGRRSNGEKIYIDSGNYEPALDKALTIVGYDELDKAKAEARTPGQVPRASACRPTSRSAASPRRSGSAPSARAGAPRCGSRPTSRST